MMLFPMVPEKVGKGANGAAVCLLFVCFSVGSRKQNERKQKSALQDVAVVCVCFCVSVCLSVAVFCLFHMLAVSSLLPKLKIYVLL